METYDFGQQRYYLVCGVFVYLIFFRKMSGILKFSEFLFFQDKKF